MSGSEEDKAFKRGFVAAITTLVRTHDVPTLARDVCQCNGFDLRDFRNIGLEKFDNDALKQAFGPVSKRYKKK